MLPCQKERRDAAIYVSAYCYIRVRILLYICPHAAIYVSAYYYTRVCMLLYRSQFAPKWRVYRNQFAPHWRVYRSQFAPHWRVYRSQFAPQSRPNRACTSCDPLYSSMRTHAIYMSSYYYICVQHQLRRSPFAQHGACTSRDPRP